MLRTRVLTALVLAAALVAALYGLPPAGWTALALLLLGLAAWEWWGLARNPRLGRLAYTLAVAGFGAILVWTLGLWTGRPGALMLYPAYGVAMLFWVVGVPLWLHALPPAPPARIVLAVGVIVLVPTFLALVQLRNIHPAALLLSMGVVWIADIAAYFAGRRFGKRKLAPKVSPGKTWAGFYGALAAAGVYGLAWAGWAPLYVPPLARDVPGTPLWMLLLVEVLAILAALGDLFESALKRQAGVKDSGRLLPGHGGVLDRIDALTAALPAAALAWMMG
ncbi:MAG: phosphatidate cytidylyltransferase [Burkholderiales bacterium]|nr:phosphatidate cytidylyltransferase [Burkholderiales bacterium]